MVDTTKSLFAFQNAIKEKNEALILKKLFVCPLRFTDLLKFTGLSVPGLSTNIKRLKAANKIKSVIYNGKIAYGLTDLGEQIVRDMIRKNEE
jgi:DNA-binding HxlR family transcriptional regulator